ncbi:unnamed protein product [marine sediment metagenome]|uniref:Uncharacterized protein n=1 Tax=marine sediment metagenome TaxID=412755 RepID=X0SU67_9ZZZZ
MRTTITIPTGTLVILATFTKLGDQEPYFSVTAEEYDTNKQLVSCGAMHDAIREHAPRSVYDLCQWHMCFAQSGPMHYLANAVYHAEILWGLGRYASRPEDANALAHFKSTVVFNESADEMPEFPALADEECDALEKQARDAVLADAIANDEDNDPDLVAALFVELLTQALRRRVAEVIALWCTTRFPMLMCDFHETVSAAGWKVEADGTVTRIEVSS